jgi:hypothetical protein
MPALTDSLSKLERAKTLMQSLNSAIQRYLDSDPCEMYREISSKRYEEQIKIRITKPIPAEIAHIVGDLIHNMRASLDYAACDLAELNQATNADHVFFPFGKTEKTFEINLTKKLKKVSAEAKQFIRELRPYRGGNERLWLIHYLDLGDKHRKLTPIGMAGSTGANIDYMTNGSISLAAPRWESINNGMRVATIVTGT